MDSIANRMCMSVYETTRRAPSTSYSRSASAPRRRLHHRKESRSPARVSSWASGTQKTPQTSCASGHTPRQDHVGGVGAAGRAGRRRTSRRHRTGSGSDEEAMVTLWARRRPTSQRYALSPSSTSFSPTIPLFAKCLAAFIL